MAGVNKLISVLLPVYNAGKYITDSVKSILDQTYTNFELIIVDDGSVDESADLIQKFSDTRILFFQKNNTGMADTLNFAFQKSSGEYIARQDADDISMPSRFHKQITFLENHQDIVLTGTWARVLNDSRILSHPSDNLTLKLFLLFDNPFVHSSVMMRKNVFEYSSQYDLHKHPLIQDYALWSEISLKGKIANIPEVLQLYREVKSGISQTTKDYKKIVAAQSAENIKSMGIDEVVADYISYIYHNCFSEIRRKISVNQAMKTYDHVVNELKLKNGIASDSFYTLSAEYRERLFKKCRLYNVLGKFTGPVLNIRNYLKG
jgi:glycosyltransferase involved in cell wall biosynthesis